MQHDFLQHYDFLIYNTMTLQVFNLQHDDLTFYYDDFFNMMALLNITFYLNMAT